MTREHIAIPCGDISLEGVLHLPGGGGLFPGVVVCHPHPLYGGDMENSVVVTICLALVARSIAALRFNFRGAGGSGGHFGGGEKEQDDVKAALDYLAARKDTNSGRLGLAGYSFGGAVAFPAAQQDNRVERLALISPALADSGWAQLREWSHPKIVLLGDTDTVVPYDRLKKYFDAGGEFQVVHDADHFWWGFEQEIDRRIGGFFAALIDK